VSTFSARNWDSPSPNECVRSGIPKPKVGSCESADGLWTAKILKLEAFFI